MSNGAESGSPVEQKLMSRREFFKVALLATLGGYLLFRKVKGRGLVSWQAALLEAKPLGRGEFLKTWNLPVVREALDATAKSRREGGIIDDTENPIGKAIGRSRVARKFDEIFERARESVAFMMLQQKQREKAALARGKLNKGERRVRLKKIEKRAAAREVKETEGIGHKYSREKEAALEKALESKVDRLVLVVYSDIHQPGSSPEKEAAWRSILYKRALKWGRNQREVGWEEDWAEEVRPRRLSEGWLAIRLTVLSNMERIQKIYTKLSRNGKGNVACAMVDVGDCCGTGSNVADVALSVVEMVTFHREVEKRLRELTKDQEVSVQRVAVQGNHDDDLRNHPYGGKYQRMLYGSQISSQEVGRTHVVLTINTNLYDPFWHEYAEKLKGDPFLKRYFRYMEKEKKKQEGLIRKAVASGRKIILVGHNEDLMLEVLALEKMRVTHIVSGDKHKASRESYSQRNFFGNNIQRVRAGATYHGALGFEQMRVPKGYIIEVNPGARKEVVVHDLVIPKYAELEEVQHLM